MPTITLDASVGAVRQSRTWDCSAASLAWLLGAAGQPTSEADAITLLGSGINPDVGLTDASGAGIVAALQGLGFDARNVGPLSFDQAAAQGAFIMGGAAFNHWTGVRGGDGTSLQLANPAPGWMGVGDSMSRAQFDQLGPFYGVWIAAAPAGGIGGGLLPALPSVSGAIAWVRANPLLAGGIAAAAYLLLSGPLSNPSGGTWQPDLFGGAGKKREAGKDRADEFRRARDEMRDTGSRDLFDVLRSPAPRRRRPRKNIDAFTGAAGVIHPIRGSKGYDPEVEQMQGEAKHEREREDLYRGLPRESERHAYTVLRPPDRWARGLSLQHLERIAREAGVSPHEYGWWDSANLSSATTKHQVQVGGREVTVHGKRTKASGEYRAAILEGAHRGDQRKEPRGTVNRARVTRLTAADRTYASRAGRPAGWDLPF